MYPVPTNKKVTSPYGAKGSAWSGGMHRGIDFGAPKGTPVYAPWSGKVTGIGTWGPAYGDRSPVFDFDPLPDGSAGLWGVVAHLDTVSVKPGDRVYAGQRIGTVGARGNTTGPHVHFEVQTGPLWRSHMAGNVSRDPKKWLEAVPSWRGGKVYESVLKPGIEGSDSVRNLQARLRQWGVYTGPISGDYGPVTRAAVQDFQRLAGLTTGAVDKATVDGLGLVWVPRVPPLPPAPEVPEPKPEPDPEPPLDITPAPPVATRGIPPRTVVAGMLARWRDYTEKATNEVSIPADGKWHLIPMKRALVPVPIAGEEKHYLYLRLFFDYKLTGGGAKVEVMFRRGDGDETAFDEKHWERGTKSVPFNETHIEEGEANLPSGGAWYIKAHGGLKRVRITTRYAKTMVTAVLRAA